MGPGADKEKQRNDDWIDMIFSAIAWGSTDRNPFLHTAVTHCAAQRWVALGEKKYGRSDASTVFCKIRIWDWYLSGTMPPVGVIDISNHKKLAAVFKGGPANCSAFVDTRFEHIRKTRDCKEVLLKWRGRDPK